MDAHFENAVPNPRMTERREIATNSPALTDHAPRPGGSIQGQLIRLSTHHTVAIYLRQGSLWVADFIDGQGSLVDANTWFRFNCGSLANSHALRRMALESAIPLSADLVERIEGLHHAAAADRSSRWCQFVEVAVTHLPQRLSGTTLGRWLHQFAVCAVGMKRLEGQREQDTRR
jgi:hypothetical protein